MQERIPCTSKVTHEIHIIEHDMYNEKMSKLITDKNR